MLGNQYNQSSENYLGAAKMFQCPGTGRQSDSHLLQKPDMWFLRRLAAGHLYLLAYLKELGHVTL